MHVCIKWLQLLSRSTELLMHHSLLILLTQIFDTRSIECNAVFKIQETD